MPSVRIQQFAGGDHASASRSHLFTSDRVAASGNWHLDMEMHAVRRELEPRPGTEIVRERLLDQLTPKARSSVSCTGRKAGTTLDPVENKNESAQVSLGRSLRSAKL